MGEWHKTVSGKDYSLEPASNRSKRNPDLSLGYSFSSHLSLKEFFFKDI